MADGLRIGDMVVARTPRAGESAGANSFDRGEDFEFTVDGRPAFPGSVKRVTVVFEHGQAVRISGDSSAVDVVGPDPSGGAGGAIP